MKYGYFLEHKLKKTDKMIKGFYFWIFLCFLLMQSVQVRAQMFSVGGNRIDRTTIPNTAVYLGLEPARFDYKGAETAVGAENFEFSGTLLRLRLESQGLNFFLGTGGKLTGIDEASYFNAGVKAAFGLRLVSEKRIIVQIPLQLMSAITSVSNDRSLGASGQFSQGSFVVGGGGEIRVRPADRFRLSASFIPNYGFSFATGGTFGGSLYALEGQFRVFFDELFGDIGLTAGYDYNFKRYDVDEEEFDYNFKGNSILVGITF